jgi:hypothetical protein
MIRLIPAIIIMFYYWLFWIKSYGKLLIYSISFTQYPKPLASPLVVGVASRITYINKADISLLKIKSFHTFHMAQRKAHNPTQIYALSFLITPLSQFPNI